MICQSCGMPMKEPADYGTNADGSKNEEYCRYCYQNGAFTEPGLTQTQQVERLADIGAEKMNISRIKAREMAKSVLPTLKRWR
jgi:hypothetical protein